MQAALCCARLSTASCGLAMPLGAAAMGARCYLAVKIYPGNSCYKQQSAEMRKPNRDLITR